VLTAQKQLRKPVDVERKSSFIVRNIMIIIVLEREIITCCPLSRERRKA
jgi:hypothetical protein